MKSLVFRREAKQDLLGIFSYLAKQGAAPTSIARVKDDIYDTVDRLRLWPDSGYAVHGQPGLRTTTPKYRFTVTYSNTPEHVEIVGVFRYQNR